jgi:hypothetical protein
MKLSEIVKLRRLAKLKSDAEKARFGAINAAEAKLRAAAAEHAAVAARPYEATAGEVSGGDLSAYGRYLRRHDGAAKERLRAADALVDERETQRAALARSLGEEAVWSRLHSGAKAVRRKKANEAEEDGRSDMIAGAAARKRG